MLEFYATTMSLIKSIFCIKNKTQCFALRYSDSIWGIKSFHWDSVSNQSANADNAMQVIAEVYLDIQIRARRNTGI